MKTRRPSRSWLVIAMSAALFACSAKPKEQAQSAPETKAPTELAEPEPALAPVKAAPPEASRLPPAPEPPGEQLYAHWDAAGQASRAIFEGDLAKAAPHLAWLAHYEYPSKLPPTWQPYAARVQLAARVLLRATTVGEALRELPTLDAACGNCHVAIADTDFNATEGPSNHGDGAHALLSGLIGGDKLFEHAAGTVGRVAGKTEPSALDALKAASAHAKEATTWAERLAATQEIYGQCGSCHEGLR